MYQRGIIKRCKSNDRQCSGQKYKQLTTKHCPDNRDPLKTGDKPPCSGMVSTSCSKTDTCHWLKNMRYNVAIIESYRQQYIY